MKLINRAIKVRLEKGEPSFFFLDGKKERIKFISKKWRIRREWWRKETYREYFQIETEKGVLCEIYRDLKKNRWFIERIYD